MLQAFPCVFNEYDNAMVKLSYNSKLVPDPGLVLQTPLWTVLLPK